jgi:hypothetical protein
MIDRTPEGIEEFLREQYLLWNENKRAEFFALFREWHVRYLYLSAA